MRLSEPRIPPLDPSEWDEETREIVGRTRGVGGGAVLQIFSTLARHPKLLKRWTVFGNHVLAKSTLPARERELAILRVAWLCRAEYEWAQHVAIARRAGVTDGEMRRVIEGAEAAGWSAADAVLLRAVDELHADSFVGEATWKALAERFGERELIDLIFCVGQYHLVAMVLNTLGVQLDPGLEGSPPERVHLGPALLSR